MLILPRKPLEAHASLYCPSPEAALYDTTARLLEASTTRRPYTGAVIRQGLRGKELAEFQAAGDKPEQVHRVASFLKPIQAALNDWWKVQPQAQNYDISPLEHYGEPVKGEIGWHADQIVEEGFPVIGPLVTSTTIKEESTYYLKVMPRDVWNPDDTVDINAYRDELYNDIPKDDSSVRTITAKPGDVVIWTEIPPTWHGVEASADRRAVLYGTSMREVVH